jgi:carbon starvation protein
VRFAWITGVPLSWLLAITSVAAWEKLFSPELRVGFLSHARDLGEKLATSAIPPEKIAATQQLVFNDHVNATLTVLFLAVIWVLTLDMLRVCYRVLAGEHKPHTSEAPYARTQLTGL